MFVPYRIRNLELINRIVVSPMSMYSSEDGMPGDFHLVHYGSRAQGGAGLVFTEMTDISLVFVSSVEDVFGDFFKYCIAIDYFLFLRFI